MGYSLEELRDPRTILKVQIDYLTSLLTGRPADISTIYERGSSFFELGEYESALQDFSQVLEMDPHHWGALGKRIQLYRIANNWESNLKAISDITTVIEIQPDQYFYYYRGYLYSRTAQYHKMELDYQYAVKLKLAEPAYKHMSSDDSEFALQVCNNAIENDPDDFNALLCRAIINRNLGNTPEFQDDFGRACLASSPEYADCFLHPGEMHYSDDRALYYA